MAARGKSGHRVGDADPDEHQALMAVLVADSFNQRFAPITLDKPRALLPLVGVPMLEYALETVAAGGVAKTYLYCCAHSDQIRDYIASSRWAAERNGGGMVVHVEGGSSLRSLGDVLRDVDAKSLARSDFLLLSADAITNMTFCGPLHEHRQRRQRDRNVSVMTMVLSECAPGHPVRCLDDDVVVAVETASNRLLHYQRVGGHGRLKFPLHIFQGVDEVQIRYDLLDPHICLCSPQVPQLFTDNFDYQTLEDFVRGVLINEEILGNQIHVQLLRDTYAARAGCLQAYSSISIDVICRWLYPHVPEAWLRQRGAGLLLGRHNVYRCSGASLGPGSVVQQDTVIGDGTTVGSGCYITRSVIGRNCVIGNNVRLEGAMLWDSVTVGDDSTVQRSVLCDGVVLKPECTVLPRCVLSFGVILGPRLKLAEDTALSLHLPEEARADEEGFSDDETHIGEMSPRGYVETDVGMEGKGYVWCVSSHDEIDGKIASTLWGLSVAEAKELGESEESDSDSDTAEGPATPPPDDTKMFSVEVMDSLQRAVDECVSCENLILEINSSKYAYNVTLRDVTQTLTRLVLELPTLRTGLDAPPVKYLASFKQLLMTWLPVFKNYIKRPSDHLDCLTAVEETWSSLPALHGTIGKVLMLFYESELLDEEAILRWFSQPPSSSNSTALHKDLGLLKFIQWLKEAEEESSDD
uniref:translation initiation factor eIF2B subunit epsilon n=1 Tax=Myxine glutinosa TaxID=7769 RepID=UPI0035900842